VTPIEFSAIVFGCVLAGVLGGMKLASVLPERHLSPESKDAVRIGMGMIATMTALILGLITASAKSLFDADDAGVKRSATDVLTLDRQLARYGAETKEIREQLRSLLEHRLNATWPEDGSTQVAVDPSDKTRPLEEFEDSIRRLTPKTDDQRTFQTRALDTTNDIMQLHWLTSNAMANTTPMPFLVVLLFWLTMLFTSFGLFAPRNATVILVFIVCALSVAASVFLILEMEQPFGGMMKVSSAPLRYALSHIGQ
jgi:hypothetical protein